MYITILSFNKLHGSKPFKIDGLVKLIKEPDNKYDTEAIACEMRYFGKIGYVSNSVNTVVKGSMSAGRVYDKSQIKRAISKYGASHGIVIANNFTNIVIDDNIIYMPPEIFAFM